MSIGTALQSAVNGFATGRNIRHGWEDRKIQNKRNERMDEIVDAREARAQQAHELDMETGGLLNTARRQSIRRTDLDWGDAQTMRGVLADADAAAEAGMLPAEESLPPATVSTSGQSDRLTEDSIARAQRAATAPVLGAIPSGPAAPAQPAAANTPPPTARRAATSLMDLPEDRAETIAQRRADQPAAIPDAAWDRFNDAVPGGTMEQATAGGVASSVANLGAIPRGPDVDLFRIRPDGSIVANRQPRNAEEKRVLLEAAKAGRLATPDDRAARQREADANTALDMPYSYGESGNLLSDLDRVGRKGKRGVEDILSRTGEAIVNQGVGSIQRLNAPFQAASRYATGKDHIGAPARVDLNKDGASESLATPVSTALGAIRADTSQQTRKAAPAHAPAAAGDAAPVSAKAVSDIAGGVVDAVVTSPSMKAATDAIPAADLGATRSRPMTPQQRQRAGQSYMQSYRENGAPLVIRQLLRQGRIDEAQKFETWVQDGKTADGMAAWGRGVFAALQGDADGAADAFMDAYNNAGYFDDGYSVVKNKSEVIKDPNSGEVVGVTLALKNEATGEIVVQTDSIEGFIEKAAWVTSPEKAYEASMARLQARQEALMKADEERRASAIRMTESNFTQTIALARDLFAKSQAAAKDAREAAMLGGDPSAVPAPMTIDEAMAEAQRIMTEGPRVGSADLDQVDETPVVRRPQ